MDPEMFLDVANQVTKLKMFPYFDIAHAALCCLHVREDLHGGVNFTRRHPLATWICSLVEIYAGGVLASLFLGEPVLGPLKSNEHLVLYTLVWYLVFYCPFDAVYKICKFLPVKLAFSVMKEIYRVKKVYDGVSHFLKVFPNGYLIALVVGTVKGNGAGFLKIFERLLRGIWTPGAIEILQPSFPTKACIAASVIFVLDKKTDLTVFYILESWYFSCTSRSLQFCSESKIPLLRSRTYFVHCSWEVLLTPSRAHLVPNHPEIQRKTVTPRRRSSLFLHSLSVSFSF